MRARVAARTCLRRVVEFATADDLESAVSKLDGSKLDGNVVTVYKAR